jgi:transcriptional regulator with XRE-family HTH domain
MSLAQRVRDCRYAKGWGPDELASRAEISRTALYQIESGKTGLPRAGTLRRIAVALEVPMEDLLGHEDLTEAAHGGTSRSESAASRSHAVYEWVPAEGGPLAINGNGFKPLPTTVTDDARFSIEPKRIKPTQFETTIFMRESELMSKLHDLLHSTIGEGVAKIVEELHVMLPRGRSNG